MFEPLLCLMVLLPTGSQLKYLSRLAIPLNHCCHQRTACCRYALLGFAVIFHLGICGTLELVFANCGALSFVVLIFQPELEGWALDPHPQTRSEEKRKRPKAGGVHRWTSMVALLATAAVATFTTLHASAPDWRQSSADEGHDDQPEKIAGVEAAAFGVCWSLGLLQDFQLLD